MARVKRGVPSKKRKKNILRRGRGFIHGRKKLIKRAKEATVWAGKRAYYGRKVRKRFLRSLWEARLNALLRAEGTRYSVFMNQLKTAKIGLNRKMLSELASDEPEALKAIIKEVGKK